MNEGTRLMKPSLTAKTVLYVIPMLVAPAAASGQQTGLKQPANQTASKATAKAEKGPSKSPLGETFYIVPSTEAAGKFNVIVTDGEERVISGICTVAELQVFRDIMNEAKRFAFSEEAAGNDEPVTTRFSSDVATNFAVDVSKLENQSHFYISLKTQ
jgi:hypothetical protein